MGKPTKEKYEKLKEVLQLDDRFDVELFNTHQFNFDDIKVEGKPYKTHMKNQKLYGQASKMADFIQFNEGYRSPPFVLNHTVVP